MATGSDDSKLWKCAVISCDKGTIKSTDGRVDTRAYALPKNERSDFQVNWDDKGFATFHDVCWYTLIKRLSKDKASGITKAEEDMIKEALKTAEIHDSYEKLKKEAEHVANLIKTSEYCIAFTGAGISTAAGIGDFRGITGKWTERDKAKKQGTKGTKVPPRNMQALRPTYTHEAIVKLLEKGYIKHVISQNVDGLHRLSGVKEGQISELHGNGFEEKCEKCKKRYVRNFRCGGKATNVPANKCKNCRINHRTGRVCDDKKCNGYLMNTIINFGDYLESDVLDGAEKHAEQSDLVLALGTTLQVSPANDLVESGQDPTRLVICNRQITDYDQTCLELDDNGVPLGSRVFGDCDKMMRELMRSVLPGDELKKWEQDREVRMLAYDTQRKL